MATLFDYIEWRGDLPFAKDDINEVDNLIFSLISYLQFDGILTEHTDQHPPTLLSVARQYLHANRGQTHKLGLMIPPQLITLMAKAAKTQRFGRARILGYVNDIQDGEQKQFCAMTFLLDHGKSFVTYRGTDDTLVGWKENFNMSFLHPVPAQLAAAKYLQRIAALTEGPLITGGHSKGGNLAVYAAVEAPKEVQARIEAIYNNDGPGFTSGFIKSPNYLAIRDKIRTIVPQSSVVGMLLEHEESYDVIQSRATGLLQHNGLSWEIRCNSFIHLDRITPESRKIDRSLKKWLSEMDAEKRELIVDSIYEKLSENAKTLTDLDQDKRKILRAWNQLDPESKALVKRCVALFVRESTRLRNKSDLTVKRKSTTPKVK